MSTDYRFEPNVPFKKVLKKLPKGIVIEDNPKNTDTEKCLTDGSDYIWLYDCGGNASFTRWGGNDPHEMLEAIADKFKVAILSEHDEGYFTDEELAEFEAVDEAEIVG